MLNIKQLIKEPLVKGAFIALIGTVLVGFGNYFFQLLMGRMLNPAEFGSLAALLSLSIILGVPNQAITLNTTRDVANLYARQRLDELPHYARNISKRIFPYGLTLFVLIMVFSSFIGGFLRLTELAPLYILGICFLFSFLAPLGTGIYQGVQNFFQQSFSQILATILKLLLGVCFVVLGWGISGALLANLFAALFAIGYVVINLKLYKKASRSVGGHKVITPLSSSAWITLLVSFCLICLYNLDVILVKHYLSADDVGYYAIISLTGKMIIFFTAAINNVMFSIAANNHAASRSNKQLITLSLSFVCLASLFITILYAVAPELIITIMFGTKYLAVSQYLWLGGVIFSLYSVINFMSLYLLSVQKNTFSVILAIGTVLEVVLICMYNKSLVSVLYSMLISMLFMTAGLVVYFWLNYKKKIIRYESSINNSSNI